jgi:hypothetical protein
METAGTRRRTMASKAVVKEIGAYEIRRSTGFDKERGPYFVRESGARAGADLFCASLEAAEKTARSLAGALDDGEGSAATSQLIAGESY